MLQRFYIAIGLSLLCLLVMLLYSQETSVSDPLDLSVIIKTDHDQEMVQAWNNEGVNYVFLPSYSDLSQAEFNIKNDVSSALNFKINGKIINETVSCDVFQLKKTYSLDYIWRGKDIQERVVFLQSSNVPTLHIDTETGSTEHIHAKKGNEESGYVRLYAADGALEYNGKLKSIKGRGNSTWDGFDKKPYSLNLSEAVDLLGMGAAENWVLLANASDASALKNKIVYDFAEAVNMSYSPESRWVDLYINGEYYGLYLLSERNEVHPQRVDLSNNDSFLISMELGTRLMKKAHIVTEMNQALRIHHPSDTITEGVLTKLKDIWQSIENAIVSENGIDQNTGRQWQDLIDLESWAQKYLIEEVFMNSDGCYASQYFYYDPLIDDQKVYAGPVWDYDYALYYDNAMEEDLVYGLYANRLHVKSTHNTPWFHELYKKEEFYREIVELYRSMYLPELHHLIDEKLDEYVNQIKEAHVMNQVRWRRTEKLEEELILIKQFIQNRTAFLNDIWLNEAKYLEVRLDKGGEQHYDYIAVKPGEAVLALPEQISTEDRIFLGWYDAETDEPFDLSQPIFEDVKLYAKWEGVPEVWQNRIPKLLPLGIIALFLTIFVIVDFSRNLRRR